MRVAIFAFETRDINTFPSIINTIKLLSGSGFVIDVFIPKIMKTDLSLPDVNIHIVSEYYHDKEIFILNTLKKIKNDKLEYDLFIPFYYEGLIVCHYINKYRIKKIPAIYFSMELLLNKNYLGDVSFKKKIYELLKIIFSLTFKVVKKIIKRLLFLKEEISLESEKNSIREKLNFDFLLCDNFKKIDKFAKKYVFLSLIQDEFREKLLKKEFSFVDKVIYVPNSYLGYNNEKSFFAYDQFNLPQNKKIILYTGGLERGFDLEILKIAEKLDKNYILFLNAYSRDDYINEIIPQFKNLISEGKIFFQLKNLNEEDYESLVKSAYIGLAWYSGDFLNNENMYYMGLSSGKLTRYLSCGIPVISSNNLFNYKNIIENNNLGKVCDKAIEILNAIKYIEENYEFFKENIKKVYIDKIEFQKKFDDVLIEIKKIKNLYL